MNVCEEDSIQTIQQKYAKRFNRDADKYIWRKKCSQENPAHLFMAKTMTQNGILFEENEKLGLPAAFWIYFVWKNLKIDIKVTQSDSKMFSI